LCSRYTYNTKTGQITTSKNAASALGAGSLLAVALAGLLLLLM
jgi:hypothetical protein